jgi:hypothetical protein
MSDCQQYPPQVISVLKLRETAGGRPSAKAIKDALSYVLLVGYPLWRVAKLPACKINQAIGVPRPQPLSVIIVCSLQACEPVTDGLGIRHIDKRRLE